MKQLTFILGIVIMSLSITSCNSKQNKKGTPGQTSAQQEVSQNQPDSTIVYVYYFHGKQRCKTCVAVEDLTRETVEKEYKGNKKVKYQEIKTFESEFEKLIEKYEVSWNALIIARGSDHINITEQAFGHAVNRPEQVEELIKSEITKRLK